MTKCGQKIIKLPETPKPAKFESNWPERIKINSNKRDSVERPRTI